MADNTLTSTEIEELIRLFPTTAMGRALLGDAGMPQPVMAALPPDDIDDFWRAAAEHIAAGVMHAGRVRLLDAARVYFPANPTFSSTPATQGTRPNQVMAGRDVIAVIGSGSVTMTAPAHGNPVAPSPAQRETKVFFAGASPFDIALDRIRADREFRAIQRVARPGQLTIANRIAASVKDFADLFDEHPDILHLSCHSDELGRLLLEDPTGEPHAIPVDSLVRLMTTYRDHGGLALPGLVLSICDSAAFAERFKTLAGTVIAWRGDLDDECAIEFAANVYRAMCRTPRPRLADAARIAASEVAESDRNCRSVTGQLVVLT